MSVHVCINFFSFFFFLFYFLFFFSFFFLKFLVSLFMLNVRTATRRTLRWNPRRFLRTVVGIIPSSSFVVVFVPIGWQFGGVACVVLWWTARICRCGCSSWRQGRCGWFFPLYHIGLTMLVIRLARSRFVFDPTIGEQWIGGGGSGGSGSRHCNA